MSIIDCEYYLNMNDNELLDTINDINDDVQNTIDLLKRNGHYKTEYEIGNA